VPKNKAAQVLDVMLAHANGANSVIIGEVLEAPKGKVLLKTGFGGERLLDVLVGEQLPRIC
jgi:hydrogenase expression/formation protein HypE